MIEDLRFRPAHLSSSPNVPSYRMRQRSAGQWKFHRDPPAGDGFSKSIMNNYSIPKESHSLGKLLATVS